MDKKDDWEREGNMKEWSPSQTSGTVSHIIT